MIGERLGDDMGHAALALHLTVYGQQAGAEQDPALALGEASPDHQVHDAGLRLPASRR